VAGQVWYYFIKCKYVYFNIFKNFLISSLQIVSSLHHILKMGEIVRMIDDNNIFAKTMHWK
jgi:hypothetical protein